MKHQILSIVFGAALSTASFAQAPVYKVVNLGSLNGQSEAFCINSNGIAVGWTYTGTGMHQACTFANGLITLLSTPSGKVSNAYGIDRFNRIVGKLDKSAVIWTSSSAYNTLGTLGGQEGGSSCIDDNGLICVTSQNAQSILRPGTLAYPNGGLIPLPLLPGGTLGSAAASYNNKVVGYSSIANGNVHACTWKLGGVQDFGTLGGPVAYFSSNSESGLPVGGSMLTDHHNTPTNKGNIYRAVKGSTTSNSLINLGDPYIGRPYTTLFQGGYKGFVWKYWDHGVFKSANVCGVDSRANGAQGDTIVGTAMLYTLDAKLITRAVIWVNGVMYDLTNLLYTSGWTFVNAWGCNNKGQIVGQGLAPNGQLLAFRLDRQFPNGTGLSYARMQGMTAIGGTPILAQANLPTGIPTVSLYVRKSDGMLATSLAGPYTYTSLLTAVLTDPVKSGVKCKLNIDERGNLSSPAANTMWGNTCNAQQTAYALGQSGLDGTQKYSWSGLQIKATLDAFPNDSELDSRWKFSANGTTWLSVRLKLKKGQGY